MTRPIIVGLRVSNEERQLLDQLAEREERTASDVVRRLIRQAAKERTPDRRDGALSLSSP